MIVTHDVYRKTIVRRLPSRNIGQQPIALGNLCDSIDLQYISQCINKIRESTYGAHPVCEMRPQSWQLRIIHVGDSKLNDAVC